MAGNDSEPIQDVLPINKPNILIVDDELSMREMLEIVIDIIYPDKLDVTFAKSGEEALEIISGNRVFAAVIIDEFMPGISGSELVIKLREIEQHKREEGMLVAEMPLIIWTTADTKITQQFKEIHKVRVFPKGDYDKMIECIITEGRKAA